MTSGEHTASSDRLAGSGLDETARVRAAGCPAAPPDVLRFLARDRSLMVRASVATNGAVPVPIAHMLAADADERVRALIARRLAALAPGLGPGEHEILRQQTYRALLALAQDEAVRVRAALSDVVKEMPDAPRALILALARDREESVADPVIRFSPLLTDGDLLGLLTTAPAAHTAVAVARRPDLTETVSDAVAATASVDAVRAMLGNPSASIREATLDALIARAAEHVDWHEPLVRRATLSPASARRLSDIVAGHALEVLARRADLPPSLLAELSRRLSDRLGRGASSWADLSPTRGLSGPSGGQTEVGAVMEAGAVTEATVMDAAERGDAALTVRLLATAADVPVALVRKAAALRSAKGLVSLVWKAGFPMRAAGPVQSLLAHIAPAALLKPDSAGGFPLSRSEMRWQLDFLARENP